MKPPSHSRSSDVKLLAAAIALAAAGGCSGGSSGALDGIDAGGSPTSVFVEAPINGFGSVIVNGVHYETSEAEIVINGSPGTEEELRVGQVVRLSAGSADGGALSAQSVVYDDSVAGPIEAIDESAGLLVVLGQPIAVNSATSFDPEFSPRSIEGLSDGDVVAVSGYVNSEGRIVATRIDPGSDDGDFQVRGRIENLDDAALTFDINELAVDYGQAVIEGGSSLGNGDLVEVSGTQSAPGEALVAARVQLESEFQDGAPVGAEIELEGFVTRFVSATDFDVSGVATTTASGTQYEDGNTANLALDVLVEVEGRFDSGGVLVADRIEFEGDGPYEIEASVESVDGDNGRFTILGIEVEVTAETRMEDDSSLALRIFTLDDINVGDRLEVHGAVREAGDMLLTATSIEREDDDGDDVSIQGVAEDVFDPSFRILSLPIDTDPDTEFDDIDRAAFFSSGEGQLVEVEGILNGGRLLAVEIELEDD